MSAIPKAFGRGAERAAWTAFFEGKPIPVNKYGVAPKSERGKYASKHEADIAGKLWALHSRGVIHGLAEQVRITLVPGNGKLRPIVYVADFTYFDGEGKMHVVDAKGFKTQAYRLKKRLAALLLGLEIEEV
jgi:Protein of unknown function (DUF1064)